MKYTLYLPLALLMVGCSSSGGRMARATETDVELIRAELADTKYTQHAYQTEIDILEGRVNRQDKIVQETAETIRNQVQSQLAQMEGKLSSLENQQGQAIADIKALGKETRESSREIAQSKKQVEKLHKEMDAQIGHLKEALHSVLAVSEGERCDLYAVKNGDSLGALAVKRHTTVDAIKELNGLKEDKIFVGQQLKLPAE